MSKRLKYSQLQGGQICFLLDVDYQGVIHRFSTFPIDLEDIAENTTIRYNGGLNDPDILQKTEILGIDIEANTISTELIFYNINWVSEWKGGRILDNSNCLLSMVIVTDNQTSQTIQDRVTLFKGKAYAGIFGSPDKPEGHIAFTIENDISITQKKLIENYQIITEKEFSGIKDDSIGKVIPFVFGKPGGYPAERTPFQIEIYERLEATPSYSIGDIALLEVRFSVCYGLIEADFLKVWDYTGGYSVCPVEIETDAEGRIYSYLDILNSISGSGFDVNSERFFIEWSSYGGGALSPYNDGTLTGAGDLCLYFLELSGLEYDYAEWYSLRSLLNGYKFAGYVNDTDTNIWTWLQESIIQYLPIEVINGGNGIKPVLNLYFYSQQIQTSHHVTDSGEFEIITGIQPLDTDIINRVTIRYSFEAKFERYKSTIVVAGNFAKEAGTLYNNPLAVTSYQKYGLQEVTLEINHLYDYYTATKIAEDIIRIRSLGAYGIEISAAAKYGYIEIGDVLSLSSSRLGLDSHKCQVVSKAWQSNRWHFIVHIEDNKLVNT